MQHNGATPSSSEGVVCCEMKTWLDNGQICWPALERRVIKAHGDWSARCWPCPHPLHWEDDDGDAER